MGGGVCIFGVLTVNLLTPARIMRVEGDEGKGMRMMIKRGMRGHQ